MIVQYHLNLLPLFVSITADEQFYYWLARSVEQGSRVGEGLLTALDQTTDDMHTTVDNFWKRAQYYSNKKDYLKQQREDYVKGSIKYKNV